MWRTVLFMAVAACVDPAKIGVVIVFVLDEVSIGKSSYSAGYRDRGRRTRPAGRHTARL